MINCPKQIFADDEEKINYDQPDFPLYLRQGRLFDLNGHRASAHYHEDLEYILVLQGQMEYDVNGEKAHLEQNEGIFVNSKALHFGYGEKNEDCVYLCLLFSPMALSAISEVEKKYLIPYLESGTSFIFLPKGAKPLDIIRKINKEKTEGTADSLIYQSLLFQLWHETIPLFPPFKSGKPSEQLQLIKTMMSYVKDHYGEEISLSALSSSCHVSNSFASMLFRHYFHQSPISYLIAYRLMQAATLLRDSDKPVEDIAFEVGYVSSSFFIRSFKKKYGVTPNRYRKKSLDSAAAENN